MTAGYGSVACMRCGSDRTIEGLVRHPKGQSLFFVAGDQTFLEEILGRQQRLLRARACADCGHVEVFIQTGSEMTLDDYEDAIDAALADNTEPEEERPE